MSSPFEWKPSSSRQNLPRMSPDKPRHVPSPEPSRNLSAHAALLRAQAELEREYQHDPARKEQEASERATKRAAQEERFASAAETRRTEQEARREAIRRQIEENTITTQLNHDRLARKRRETELARQEGRAPRVERLIDLEKRRDKLQEILDEYTPVENHDFQEKDSRALDLNVAMIDNVDRAFVNRQPAERRASAAAAVRNRRDNLIADETAKQFDQRLLNRQGWTPTTHTREQLRKNSASPNLPEFDFDQERQVAQEQSQQRQDRVAAQNAEAIARSMARREAAAARSAAAQERAVTAIAQGEARRLADNARARAGERPLRMNTDGSYDVPVDDRPSSHDLAYAPTGEMPRVDQPSTLEAIRPTGTGTENTNRGNERRFEVFQSQAPEAPLRAQHVREFPQAEHPNVVALAREIALKTDQLDNMRANFDETERDLWQLDADFKRAHGVTIQEVDNGQIGLAKRAEIQLSRLGRGLDRMTRVLRGDLTPREDRSPQEMIDAYKARSAEAIETRADMLARAQELEELRERQNNIRGGHRAPNESDFPTGAITRNVNHSNMAYEVTREPIVDAIRPSTPAPAQMWSPLETANTEPIPVVAVDRYNNAPVEEMGTRTETRTPVDIERSAMPKNEGMPLRVPRESRPITIPAEDMRRGSKALEDALAEFEAAETNTLEEALGPVYGALVAERGDDKEFMRDLQRYAPVFKSLEATFGAGFWRLDTLPKTDVERYIEKATWDAGEAASGVELMRIVETLTTIYEVSKRSDLFRGKTTDGNGYLPPFGKGDALAA